MDERVEPSDVHGTDLSIATIGPKVETSPELLVMRDETVPAVANTRATDEIDRTEIGENREQHGVGK